MVRKPGLFGWGKSGFRIEIWRVGTWYHWKADSHDYVDASSGSQLPDEYRRFWKEPAEKEPPAKMPATRPAQTESPPREPPGKAPSAPR
jgi:hypothetical protein